MTTIGKECIVHDRKYLSKFHGIINQIRRTNEFNFSILQQLPKRCCSCQNQTGESSLTIDHLRNICQEIQSSKEPSTVTSEPVKSNHYAILEFPSTLTPLQRIYKAGRFVGRNGQHLRLLEHKLNVRINIFNTKSSKHFRQIVDGYKKENEEKHANDLWVIITMDNNNNDKNNIEKIKQSIQDEWNQIDVITRKKSSKKIHSTPTQRVRPIAIPSANISGDTRWKPKKNKRTDKHQRKQNESIEHEEVPPQPTVRPISMPKEVSKSHKNKRQ